MPNCRRSNPKNSPKILFTTPSKKTPNCDLLPKNISKLFEPPQQKYHHIVIGHLKNSNIFDHPAKMSLPSFLANPGYSIKLKQFIFGYPYPICIPITSRPNHHYHTIFINVSDHRSFSPSLKKYKVLQSNVLHFLIIFLHFTAATRRQRKLQLIKSLSWEKSCSSRLQQVMKCSSSLSSRGKAIKMLELRHPVQDRLSYAQPYTVEMFNKKAKGQTCFFFFFFTVA